MSYQEYNEHLGYWRDEVKLDRYRRALAETVHPGDTVLDLGTGSGMLGLLACEAGAGKVYAVDAGAIGSVAAEVFERNGFGDRVEVIRALSSDVRLPDRVDLVLGDQIGGLAYSAGVFKFYDDAARRLMKPGGVTVPDRFDLVLAAVEHESAREAIDPFRHPIGGFDLAPLHRLVQNTIRPVFMRDEQGLLSSPETVHRRLATDASRIEIRSRLHVTREGRLDGIAGMFVAQMSPSVRMSNVPGHPDLMGHRWQDFFPIDHPIPVQRGDVVDVEFQVNPVSYLAAWSVSVERSGVRAGVEHHSSFEGQLLDPARLRLLAGRPVRLTEVGVAAARLLADLEGQEIDVDVVTQTLADRLPQLQRTEIDRVVRGLAAVLSSGSPEVAAEPASLR